MPGLDFPGDPDHYPHRDEVAAYLCHYAASLGADIRTGTAVTAIEAHVEGGFVVRTATGPTFHAAGVVAATGSFGAAGTLCVVIDRTFPLAHATGAHT